MAENRLSVGERQAFLDEFVRSLEKDGLGAGTIQNYSYGVRKFLEFATNIDDVEHYNNFLLEHAVQKRSYYYYEALKKFARVALRKDKQALRHILHNLLKPQKKDPERGYKFIDKDVSENVIASLTTFKHRIIARMQYELGKRVGDILRLTKECFQTDATNADEPLLVINFITKGEKRHTMWVYNPELSADIQRFVAATQGSTRIFVDESISNEGANAYTMMRTNYKRYWIDLKQALRNNGVAFKDWATHDWRRAYARRVWDKYKDLNVLKEALGHSDVGSTIKYLRTSGLTNKDVLRELNDDKNHT